MIAKLIIASLLVGSPAASAGQDVARSTGEGASAMWPHMHQCTLAAVSRLAIKTKGTSAHRGAVAGDVDGDGWRIDLHLAGSPDGSGGPTISAHAINTKGTGANTGRVGLINQNPIGIDCVKSQVTGDPAAQKATLSSFTFMAADGKGVGWSCSVAGSEDKPIFRIGLLVPPILGQGETPLEKSSWSWGVSNGPVSIVRRTAVPRDSWHVACSSKEPRKTDYDLALLKKA